jgi:hypothetical protein
VAREILRSHVPARGPWLVVFAFGLLHGLGFAGALSEIGLPGNAIPVALLFFNIGVELGQLAFIVLILAVARVLHRLPIPRRDWVLRVPAYAIGSVAAFWTIQRVAMF